MPVTMTPDQSFTEEMRILDAVLTGKDPKSGRGRILPSLCIENYILYGGEYYLSDGGYSRLICQNEEPEILLSSVSTDEVKSLWRSSFSVASIRHRINELLVEAKARLLTKDAEGNS